MKRKYITAFLCFALSLTVLPFAQANDPYFNEKDFMMEDESDSLFADIDNYDWEDSVQYLGDEKIIQGYADGTYKPDQKMNRAEFTKIVIEGFFEEDEFATSANNCFSDVASDDWYSKYVCFAKGKDIIAGYPDGSFGAGKTVNQAEALKIVLNAYLGDFKSDEDDENWYDEFLKEAESSGMMYFEHDNGPEHEVTRGEMAYFMTWLLTDGAIDQIEPKDFDEEYDFNDDDFQFEAQTQADCLDDEEYDAVDEACYWIMDEEDEAEVDLSDDLTGNKFHHHPFGNIAEKYSSDETDYTNEREADSSEDRSEDRLNQNDEESDYPEEDPLRPGDGRYKIKGNTIVLHSGEAKPEYQEVWDYFVAMMPAKYRSNLQLVTFYTSDDPYGASVAPLDENGEKWSLSINMDGIVEDGVTDVEAFDELLVHEMAHVITLNNTQVDFSVADEEACDPQFFTGEGCAFKKSFINVFVKKFWKKDMLEKVYSLELKPNPTEADYEQSSKELYQKYTSSFVTEYAAMNPGEDIAETFATFVYKTKPTSSESVRDQKVLFFYDFPSLVTLRKNIRSSVQ